MRPSPRGIPERLVLVAGLLSAALLAWAAFRAVDDPRASGKAALSRLAGETADGVVAEWNRLLREDEPPVAPLGDVFAWTPAAAELASAEPGTSRPSAPPIMPSVTQPVSPPVTPPAAPSEPGAGAARASAFDALLGEARRLEMLQGDPAQALAVVQQALPAAPDAARRGAAHLRLIQLAVRTGRTELVTEHWAAARAELDGAESLPPDAPADIAPADTSLLLLCGLAAAPALDDPARAELCALLVARWCDGTLALPEPRDALLLDAALPGAGRALPGVRREALRRRLAAVAPGCSNDAGGAAGEESADGADRASSQGGASAASGTWRADAGRRKLAALAHALGGLPGGLPGGAARDGAEARVTGWQLDTRAALPFLWRTRPDGASEARFTTWAALRARLAEALDRHALLPDGFLLDWGDAAAPATPLAAGSLVRERTPLAGADFGFALRHRDPDAFISEESRRAAWLRGGLLVLAALTAVAAALTARTLRRERALAGLRSAFIAGVSHELRTPVSSILLMADNLQAGRVHGEAALSRYHALIRREALRLRRLVDDVLDMSRLERGEPVRLAIADLALPDFVADLAAEARELVERAGGRFRFAPDALPAAAALDAESVRRAVLNLVENALRHSGSRDVSFGARVEPAAAADGSGDTLVLRVADGGRGIALRDRERVFQPFERLSPAPAARDGSSRDGAPPGTAGAEAPRAVAVPAAPGVGLGLAIVRAIAEGHGGTARVADVPGPGAAFEIRLPLQAADREAGPRRAIR